jgi:hypothetical protein
MQTSQAIAGLAGQAMFFRCCWRNETEIEFVAAF